MLEKPIVLIANPSAGGGGADRLLPDAQEALRGHAIEFELVRTTDLEHGREAALQAVADDKIPVVMSGDGLIGMIGGALAGSGSAMGILPGGRGNDLARVLGIPRGDIAAAVDVLAAGHVREIDVGVVNDHRFLGLASFGFDSDANRIANEAKFVRGQAVYLYAALRALAAWKPARFELRVDGEPFGFTGYSVAIANSRCYGGGMMIAPMAELDDGLFHVICTADVPKLTFLRGFPGVFKGAHVGREEITVLSGAVIEVTTDRPFAVYTDGDHFVDTPLKATLLPGALGLIAPALVPE